MLSNLFTVLLSCTAFTNAYNGDSLNASQNKKTVIIDKVNITGNKKTRPYIILRELPFKAGDTVENIIFQKEILQSKQNLLNTYLFNFVTVTSFSTDSSGKASVNIDLKEGWYTWPYPIFDLVDRDFNEWISSGASLRRIDYGLTLEQHNVRGRNETVSISYEGGLDQQYSISYAMPYITRRQVHGLSLSTSYFRTHEIAYNTIDNHLRRFRMADSYLAEVFSAGLTYTYRPEFYIRQTITLGGKIFNIADTVLKRNPYFFNNNNLQQKFMNLTYSYRADYRDYKPYALNGSFFEVVLVKQGLGMPFENVNMLFSNISYHRYWPVHKKMYISSGLEFFDIYFGSRDYVSQTALGYENNYIRGYEPYVVSGQHWAVWKNNFKIALLQNKIVKVKFIPTEKFSVIPNSVYFNINTDLGYVSANKFNVEMGNTFTNRPLYSTGLGLDYVTYYGWLLRFEYSVNHLGVAGLYIHFTNPI